MEEKEAERLRELEIIEVQQALEAQRELERKAIALKEEERKEAEKDQNAEEEAIVSPLFDITPVFMVGVGDGAITIVASIYMNVITGKCTHKTPSFPRHCCEYNAGVYLKQNNHITSSDLVL